MVKERIANLLDKEMDRRSFLVHVAASAVALIGVSAAARAFSGSTATTPQKATSTATNAMAYGGSRYGR